MRTYVFLDLDDTIFQTRPKCSGDGPFQPVAYDRDGVAHSFMTERQVAFLTLLQAGASIIPTTARSLAAFRRVRLPFFSLAVLDFGGVILLPNGAADRDWDDVVRPQALATAAALHQKLLLTRRFIESRALGINARLIADFDMPLYLVLKQANGDAAGLEVVQREHWADIDPEQFFIHCNGNNLSLVPRFLGKERAVRHILDHHIGDDAVLTIGMGDSMTDAPFLALCDFAVVPRGCQLAARMLASLREGDV